MNAMNDISKTSKADQQATIPAAPVRRNYEADMDLIFQLTDTDLHDYIKKIFILKGKKTVSTEKFLYVPGTIPVLLIAHLDTVHKDTPTVCKSHDGDVLMAPEGIGGDDRAGVWINMQVLKKHDCHVLFTHDEETGGGGATEFTRSGIMPEVNYIVEPDRQGENDAVFYDCGNLPFVEFVTDVTGYKETFGTFSDISIIAPYMDRAAVNLSSGYFRAHTNSEYVRVSNMQKTIDAICKLIGNPGSGMAYTFDEIEYTYVPSTRYAFGSGYTSPYNSSHWWDKYDEFDVDDNSYWRNYKSKGQTSLPSTTVSGQVTQFPSTAKASTPPATKPVGSSSSDVDGSDDDLDEDLEVRDSMLMQETRQYIFNLTGYWVDTLVIEDVADAVRDVLDTYWAYPVRD